jgi:hypothetical protein
MFTFLVIIVKMDGDSAILEASLRLLANTKVGNASSALGTAGSYSNGSGSGGGDRDPGAGLSSLAGVVAVVKAEDVQYFECETGECEVDTASKVAADQQSQQQQQQQQSQQQQSQPLSGAVTKLVARALACPEVAINPARFAAFFESRASALLEEYASEVRAVLLGTSPSLPPQQQQAAGAELAITKPKKD